MKVAIVGSRGYPNLKAVKEYVENLPPDTTVVSGGARDVDTVAAQTAVAKGFPTQIFKPDWQKYGKAAGYIRNVDIVAAADRVVAFWDGISKGTKHSIDLAVKTGKPLEIIKPNETTTPILSGK
jgi:hypothetical protein